MIVLSKDCYWQLENLDIMFTNSNGMIRSPNNRDQGMVLNAQKENRWNCGNEVRSEWHMTAVSLTGRIYRSENQEVREGLAHLTIGLKKSFEGISISFFHNFGHCRFWRPDSQKRQAYTTVLNKSSIERWPSPAFCVFCAPCARGPTDKERGYDHVRGIWAWWIRKR